MFHNYQFTHCMKPRVIWPTSSSKIIFRCLFALTSAFQDALRDPFWRHNEISRFEKSSSEAEKLFDANPESAFMRSQNNAFSLFICFNIFLELEESTLFCLIIVTCLQASFICACWFVILMENSPFKVFF